MSDLLRTVTVTERGVFFGPDCWLSHEQITGLTAAELNSVEGRIVAKKYLNWLAIPIKVKTDYRRNK